MNHWHRYDGAHGRSFLAKCVEVEGSCGDHPWEDAANCEICGAWCMEGLSHVVLVDGHEETWCCDDFAWRVGER